MPGKVSIVLPTYNESGNIVDLVIKIAENIPTDWEYEIVVVDDASPDDTYNVVSSAFRDDPRVIPILRTTDRGFAKSIQTGIERATGDQIMIMDSDFTHDPVEIPNLLHVSAVYDIVIGSRFCPGGRMQDTAHYLASMIFNWFVRVVIRTQIQDNLGGYFTMKTAMIKRLPFEQIFFGYGDYFFRLLHYSQRQHMSIVEIPAQYMARRSGNSKSRFWKMLWSYTLATFYLRFAAHKHIEENQNHLRRS
jgi:dolichol-phosphate mannosyltransferase